MKSFRFAPRPAMSRGFTLMEMLVVLVIIGLVMGLVGPRIFANLDNSKVKTAAVQIKLLGGALETLRMDTGSYPTTEQGLAALVTPPADPAQASRWKGPYLDTGVPEDPWGNAYHYKAPGDNQRPFTIWSYGADGKPGGTGNDADIGLAKPADGTP